MTEYIKRKWRQTGTPFKVVLCLLCLVSVVLVVMAVDMDNDGMSDEYENFFGLNVNSNDAALNYDSDTLVNSNEYALWTDPFTADTDMDGWNDGPPDDDSLSRAFIDWGNPFFTSNDTYQYTGPAWWLGAMKDGGEWQTNPSAWHVQSSDTNIAALYIDVDRNILTSDVVLEMTLFGHANASLFTDLLDTNNNLVVSDIFGNLVQGNNQTNSINESVPFETYTNAAVIYLRRGQGEITVYDSLIFIDQDGDGLDREQEQQLQTSDQSTDTDGDGLSDFDEVFIYGTDPANVDSDNDGMSDGAEIAHGFNAANFDSYASVPFTEAFETNTVTAGDINNKNGWISSPANTAIVQTNVVHGGDQALEIQASSSVGTVHHLFGAAGANVVWSDLYLQPVRRNVEGPPELDDTSSVGLYVNSNGYLVVRDGAAWTQLTNHPIIQSSTWTRLTVKQDFSAQTWDLWLNNVSVAANLDFAVAKSEYTIAKFRGGTIASTYLDDLGITTSEPSGLDNDDDGMPNSFEDQYGLNKNDPSDASLDPDVDGLTNLEEFQNGTDPNNSDTDNDGMSDGAEITHGFNATNFDSYASVPFAEAFETNTVTAGDINGKNGWLASPANTAIVQTNVVHAGGQALEIQGSASTGTVHHLFGAIGENIVWSDLYLQPVRRDVEDPPEIDNTSSVGLYVNSNGYLVVRDGAAWTQLTNHPIIQSSTWTRLTVRQDFTAQTWDLWLNNVSVAANLDFAVAKSEYTIAKFKGSMNTSTYLDDLDVVTSEPSGLDNDGDGMPNSFEDQYGFNKNDPSDASLDPDVDGLTNLEEFQNGTDPNNSDTDGDGLTDGEEVNTYGTDPTDVDSDDDNMGDNAEIAHGFNATNFDSYASVPFTETFETNTVTAGDINGKNGWIAAPADTAIVQTNIVHGGGQALKIQGSASIGTVHHLFGAIDENLVWSDLYLQPVRRNVEDPPEIDDTSSAALYVNSNGFLVVRDGAGWTTLTNHPVIQLSTWVRLTVKQDFGSQKWALWLDSASVATNLDLAVAKSEYTIVQFKGGINASTYLDDLNIATIDSDVDSDGIPGWWEIENGLDPGNSSDAGEDPDNDGVTNLQEYQIGTNPGNPDTDGDEASDGLEIAIGTDPLDPTSFPAEISGAITYDGDQIGPVVVIAATVFGGWTSEYEIVLSSPGAYTISNVPTLNNYWVKAYRDSNQDTTRNFWEAHGSYIGNPVNLNGDTSVVNVVLLDPDTDTDGLLDWWEMMYLGTLAYGPGDDVDGDGLTNLEEHEKASDPGNSNTDRDRFDDGIDSNAVSRAFIDWGHPDFTFGDDYVYTGPDWLLRAYKVGGEWATVTMLSGSSMPEGMAIGSSVTNPISVFSIDWENADLILGDEDIFIDPDGVLLRWFFEVCKGMAVGSSVTNPISVFSIDWENADLILGDKDIFIDPDGMPLPGFFKFCNGLDSAKKQLLFQLVLSEHQNKNQPLVLSEHQNKNQPHKSNSSCCNPSEWHVPASEPEGTGRLHIVLDRNIVTNDLDMDIWFIDHPGSTLYIDLLDTNYAVVASNLYGNIITSSNNVVVSNKFDVVPLEAYPEAAVIQLRRGTGEITVCKMLIYEDQDDDTLDAAEEAMLGTSDFKKDTDGDDYEDGFEVDVGTDPTDPIYFPGTRYVSMTGSNVFPYTNWAEAATNIQDAFAIASSVDEIWVAEGTYKPGNSRTNSFNLKSGVALYGGFNATETQRDQRDWAAHVTTLSGDIGVPGDDSDNSYHVVVGCDNAILDGFTVRGGAGSNGGGMYNYNCSPTVANCTFSGSSASRGGGMLNDFSSPTVANCTFSGNSAGYGGGMNNGSSFPTVSNCNFVGNSAYITGGGMYNLWASSPMVANCTFSDNSGSVYGGGMCNVQSSPTVVNCTFSGNDGFNSGGGMLNQSSSSPTVENCTFNGNYAHHGGGMRNEYSSSPTVSNCTFSGNIGLYYGGGMNNYWGCSPTVVNCTFTGNSGGNDGGAIFNGYASSPMVKNCILWGDTASYDKEIGGLPATVTYSCVDGGYAGTGNITNAPLFVDAGDPDGPDNVPGTADDGLRLDSPSPCIDAGTGVGAPESDILGIPRPLDGDDDGAAKWDMGAYEYIHSLADSDDDGMPDEWEILYELNPGDGADAALDPDLDGLTNLGEFLAGAAPNNPDSDEDGMFDGFEVAHDFDPLDPADAAQDADADGLTNLEEFINGTDPREQDTDRDGILDGSDIAPVSRAFFPWGDPRYTVGDDLEYFFPEWVVRAHKVGGDWGSSWVVDASASPNTGELIIELDRQFVSDDILLDIRFEDFSSSTLFVDTLDENDAVVRLDIFAATPIFDIDGTDDGTITKQNLLIPWANDVPPPTKIRLRRGVGQIIVYDGTIRVDVDGDGLDAFQEAAYGSSDRNVDSDCDGLLDGDEENLYQTDPAKSDTDGDVLSDGGEVLIHGTDPNLVDTNPDPQNLTDAQEIYGIFVRLLPNGGPNEVILLNTVATSTYEVFWRPTLFDRSRRLLAETDIPGVDGDTLWTDTGGPGRPAIVERRYYDGWVADDTDNDGLGSGFELSVLGTYPDAVDFDCDGIEDGLEDFDGDGLLNIEEFMSLTNPKKGDTDDDGFSDGILDPDGPGGPIVAGPDLFPIDPSAWEDTDGDGMPNDLIGPSSSEPLLIEDDDDDNDGLTDVFEITIGSNPLLADSDGDGYSDFDEVNHDGNSSVYDPFPGGGDTDVNNSDTDGDLIPDGFEASFAFLDPLNAVDAALDQDSDGLSNLDESIFGTDLSLVDTDGDGYNDFDEINHDGNSAAYNPFPAGGDTDAVKPDTDGDGISDGEEVILGVDGFITDPLLFDSDGDGVSDGDEVQAGSPPDNAINVVPNSIQLVLWTVPATPIAPLPGILSSQVDNLQGTPLLTLDNADLPTVAKAGILYTDSIGNMHAATEAAGWLDLAKAGANDAILTLSMNTLGAKDISLRFDYQSELATDMDLAYSIDGGLTFSTIQNNLPLTAGLAWQTFSIDLSEVNAIENHPNVLLRFDNLEQGPGNNQFYFDNFEITGELSHLSITIDPNTRINPPIISATALDQTDPSRVSQINFTVGHDSFPASALTVTAISSDPDVVPNESIILGNFGTGADRQMGIRLEAVGVGYTEITLTVRYDNNSSLSLPLQYAISDASRTPVTLTTPGITRFHIGAGDASTAVALDQDFMFVADDDDSIIRLYDRHNSGLPISTFDFSLDLVTGGGQVDIEASTRIGNRIYLLGSHSSSSDGTLRPNTERLFAVDIAGIGAAATLTYVVDSYDNLRTDLVAWDASNGHGLGADRYGFAASTAAGISPRGVDGFNIEGMAMAPDNTTAYIAFRTPISPAATRTDALIVPITGFEAWFNNGAPVGAPPFGVPIELDLDGRGIRSIEKNAMDDYLIIAGGVDTPDLSAPDDFRLYTWTGVPGSAPVEMATDLRLLDTRGSFESIVEVPDPLIDVQVQLLLDNGATEFYNDGRASEALLQNHRKFRSDWVTVTLTQVGTIRGTVWEDLDGDWFRDVGEPPMPEGWVIWLDQDGDGQVSAGEEITQASSTSGEYTFSDLVPDTYMVRAFSLPVAGVDRQTRPGQSLYSIPIAAGEVRENVDFGFFRNYSPVVQNMRFAILTDAALADQVLGSDANSDSLTYSVVDQPDMGGTVTMAGDGTFTFQSFGGFVGLETFTYRANDGVLDSSLGTVYIYSHGDLALDTDMDNLPDWWEDPHGGVVPEDDDDGDGWRNIVEFRLRTNPDIATENGEERMPEEWWKKEIEAKWSHLQPVFNQIIAAFPNNGTYIVDGTVYNLVVRFNQTSRRFTDIYYDNATDDLFGSIHSFRHRIRARSDTTLNTLASFEAATWTDDPGFVRLQYKTTPKRFGAVWFREEVGNINMEDSVYTDLTSILSPPLASAWTAGRGYDLHRSVTEILANHPGFDYPTLVPKLEVLDYRYRIVLRKGGTPFYEISLNRVKSGMPPLPAHMPGDVFTYETEVEIVKNNFTLDDIEELFRIVTRMEADYILTPSATSKGGVTVPDF